MQFLSKLFGLGAESFRPGIVRIARTLTLVGLTAALGGALDGVNAIDWHQYVQEDDIPIVVFVMGGLTFVLESLVDEVKRVRVDG
jgi:hypothetical protein